MIGSRTGLGYNSPSMKQAVFERSGVLMEVKYEIDPDGVPCIHSMRALGDNYQAVGPDLTAMLDGVAILLSETEATPFLSAVVDELPT